jgi:hypothetical protein
MEKTCKACTRTLPIDEFYRNSKGAARQPKCKECTRVAVRKNREAKLDYYRARDRERGKLPHRKALSSRVGKRWRESVHGREARLKSKARYPGKFKARYALSNAVRDGRVERKPCEVCGAKRVHAHHDDYGKPLDVRWLCTRCHGAAHAAQNGRWRQAVTGSILQYVTEHGPKPLAEYA